MIANVVRIGAYHYFRRKVAGKTRYHRLPAPDHPDFSAAYAALASPEPAGRPKPAKGTLAALVVEYRGSTDFTAIPSGKTRANYLRYLDMIVAEHGHRRVDQLRPAHIYKMRDRMSDLPGKANNWLTVTRVLLGYATKLDWRGDNPAAGIKALPLGEHEPWPADLLRVCLDVATPMTRMLIVAGLCSGQRNSDVIRMQWGWIDGGIMQLKQQKTDVEVAIPMHPLWLDELARHPRKAVTLLYDRTGRPFGTTGAVQSRMRDLMAMKEVREIHADLVAREAIPEGQTFVFHGLRKNACCYLLELGLNDSQVGSMLGMSPQMVRHYGKRARALMIAKTAETMIAESKVLNWSPQGAKSPRRKAAK